MAGKNVVGVALSFCLGQEAELEAVEIKYLILSILTRMDRIRNECMVHMVGV